MTSINRKVQIKTTMTFHLTPVRMEFTKQKKKITKTKNKMSACDIWRKGSPYTLLERKSIWTLWKTV